MTRQRMGKGFGTKTASFALGLRRMQPKRLSDVPVILAQRGTGLHHVGDPRYASATHFSGIRAEFDVEPLPGADEADGTDTTDCRRFK